MSLKMSKQARIELLSVWRAKYASVSSRYKKARIIDYIIQSAGYKNRKTVIRLLSSKKAPPGKKKRGRDRTKIVYRSIQRCLTVIVFDALRKHLQRGQRSVAESLPLQMAPPGGRQDYLID